MEYKVDNYTKALQKIAPLYDIINGIDIIINENDVLKKENKYLKERLDWFEKNLENSANATGEIIGHFVDACLSGRITINEDTNETIIKHQ